MNIEIFEKEKQALASLGIKYRVFKSDPQTEKTGNILVYSDTFSENINFVEYKGSIYYIPKDINLDWYSFNKSKINDKGEEVFYARVKINKILLLNNTLYNTILSINKKKEIQTIDLVESIKEPVSNSVVDEFRIFLNTLLDKYEEKSKEYTTSVWDENFKKGARIRNKSREEIALDYATKHLVSIMDIIDGKKASKELVDEKIGDLQIYLLIIRKLLHER